MKTEVWDGYLPGYIPFLDKDLASSSVSVIKESQPLVDAFVLSRYRSLNGSVLKNMTISSWILDKFSYFAALFEAYNTLDLWLTIRKK